LPTGGDRRAGRWLASRDGPRTRPSDAARRHPSARGARRIDHLPGQHYVVRLTADDGCTAQRSYSVASPPSDPLVELFADANCAGPGGGCRLQQEYLLAVVRL